MCELLTPFVYWAQNKNQINLKVELINAKNTDVYLTGQKLKFFASGEGAKGLNNYSFCLHFYSSIDSELSNYEVLEKQINFILEKKVDKWWPRLTCEPQKPHWLRIDFDKWVNDCTDSPVESNRDICEDYPDVYDRLHKEEFGYKKEDLNKVYLVFYILFQCIGFMYIFIVMGIKYYRDGEVECFKSTLSKGLGLGIIAGSLFVKVPQIVKILQNKSVEGLSIIGILLELFAITATLSYSFISGFPFSAWGDAVFLAIQTIIIACLVMFYNNGMLKVSAFLVAYASVIIAVITGLAPLDVLWGAQASNIPVILTSKSIQAYTNFKNGSTGQLSAVTCLMLFFGSLARIFTSVQETGDSTIILMYVFSTLANGMIVAQLIYYWNAEQKKSVKSKKQK